MQIGIAKRPFPNDPHCGDECAYWQKDAKITLCIVDGLGHGWGAEQAAKAAVDYVAQHISEPLPDIFAGCDRAIRHTRGGVMGIAVVDKTAGTLTYAGVGNSRIIIVRPHHRAQGFKGIARLSNRPGVVGNGCGRVLPETVALGPDDLVLLFTDGIPGEIDLKNYTDMLGDDVQQLAQRIVQDWGRKRDDVAVLVFRNGGT